LFINELVVALKIVKQYERYEGLKFDKDSCFKKIFDDTWQLTFRKNGYYSASQFCSIFSDFILRNNTYTSPLCKKYIASLVRRGLITYEYVPSYYLGRNNLTDQYIKYSKIPWMKNNVTEFLNYIMKQGAVKHFYIWTKGENSKQHGIPEQLFKYKKSGLKKSVLDLDASNKTIFFDSPNKLQLIREIAKSKDNLIIIDDDIKTLLDVQKIVNKNKDCYLILFSEQNKLDIASDGIKVISNHKILVKYLKSIPNKPTIVVSDMDGVLIHDKFRNEHQPKNLHFTCIDEELIADTELYNQKQLLENIDLKKIKSRIINKDQTLLLITGPSGSGKSSIITQVLKNNHLISLIPRVTTREKRYDEFDRSMYSFLNQPYFESLISNHMLLEYGYFGPGYYGTMIDSVIEILNSSDKIIFEADVDTIVFMSKILDLLNISNKRVMILPISTDRIDQSTDILAERIVSRNSGEQLSDISGRVKKGEYTMKKADEMDEIIINGPNSFDNSVLKLESLFVK
ncbi:MAG: hypothetical protein Q7R95_08480, partial [bacterium]|nr:hypothetical protein [bacterium]